MIRAVQRRSRGAAVPLVLLLLWAFSTPGGCTRTVCDEAVDICREPLEEPLDADLCTDEFFCTSKCVVDLDTCTGTALEDCVDLCRAEAAAR